MLGLPARTWELWRAKERWCYKAREIIMRMVVAMLKGREPDQWNHQLGLPNKERCSIKTAVIYLSKGNWEQMQVNFPKITGAWVPQAAKAESLLLIIFRSAAVTSKQGDFLQSPLQKGRKIIRWINLYQTTGVKQSRLLSWYAPRENFRLTLKTK